MVNKFPTFDRRRSGRVLTPAGLMSLKPKHTHSHSELFFFPLRSRPPCDGKLLGGARFRMLLPVVAPAEILLQPTIERDEQIPAAHLLNFELRDAIAAVAPGDGDHGPRIAADDGFERKFDGEVKVR